MLHLRRLFRPHVIPSRRSAWTWNTKVYCWLVRILVPAYKHCCGRWEIKYPNGVQVNIIRKDVTFEAELSQLHLPIPSKKSHIFTIKSGSYVMPAMSIWRIFFELYDEVDVITSVVKPRQGAIHVEKPRIHKLDRTTAPKPQSTPPFTSKPEHGPISEPVPPSPIITKHIGFEVDESF